MKKYKIEFEEKVILRHEVIIEIPSDTSINDICNHIEQDCQRIYDIAAYVNDYNGKQIDFTEDTSGETEMVVESFRECKE
ncbi:hypothetical protein NBN67_10010 [Clostridioides difficile]|uniref:hypothetical protein n=1 Tax=Clostridioides TaxID=1870884 RepID=UPI000D1F7968|nr:hypothetical protein [Clostridioides difficile]MCC0707363.1 hypothetical protein [Clostridioides sp. ES-S-0190-01]MBF9867521.1 hypothetical protein [Clostridioides difficile]MBY1216465.1 hypothetical protein [Clostridioides difficile]MBZ1029652.1 hypothetical protein [Clostridioides difficile]MCA0852520.1 hypothetical protein [Clostridioides difficile]